jgi:hypothetical protein
MPLPSPSQCCPQALDIITFFLYDGGDASTLEAGEERVVRPILFDLSKSYFSSSKDERERKNYDQQPTLRQAVPFVLDQGTMDAAFELNDSLNPDLILSPYDAIFLEHGEGKDFRVGLLCGPAFGDFLFTNYSPRDHLRIDPWFQHKGEACPMPYTLFLGRDETPCYIEVNADEAIRQGFKFKNDYSKFNAGKVQRQLATPEWTKKLRELVFGEEFVRTTPWINRIGVVANEAAFDPRFNKIWSLKGFPTILVTLLSALVIMGRCRLSKRNVEPQGYWLNKRNQPKSHTIHTVVSIDTSERPIRDQLRDKVPGRGVREHEVRSHWRTIRRGRPDEYQVKIRSYVKGDSEIGKVIHDSYRTSRVERVFP